MPTLPVTDVPVQISQSITKTALLQNTGTPSVYLANDASVSPNAYGMVLTKGSSCVWPANSDLWAVTETGARSSVSVLYGASGASLGQVSASIDGPVDANVTGGTVDVGNTVAVQGTVNVGTPVNVLGGGELLYDTTENLNGSTYDIDIPGGAINYYGYMIRLWYWGSASSSPSAAYTYTVRARGAPINDFYTSGSIARKPYDSSTLADHSFVIPNFSNDGITIRIYEQTLASNLRVQVYGTASAPPVPTTFWYSWGSTGMTRQSAVPTADVAYIPPSYQPLDIIVTPNNTNKITQVTYVVFGSGSGGAYTLLDRMNRSPYYPGFDADSMNSLVYRVNNRGLAGALSVNGAAGSGATVQYFPAM